VLIDGEPHHRLGVALIARAENVRDEIPKRECLPAIGSHEVPPGFAEIFIALSGSIADLALVVVDFRAE
jgi:hypothetical protein